MNTTTVNFDLQDQRAAQASGSSSNARWLAMQQPARAPQRKWQASMIPRRRGPGFTLVELIVVILMIGILSAVSLPRFAASLGQYRVSAAAERIVADLVQAQSAAYGSSTSKTVTFNVASSSYEVAGVRPLDNPSGPYVIDLKEAPYQSRLVSVWDQTGVQTITFNGYGLPDQGGTIIVASGNAQKSIAVSASTGTAVVQ